MTLQPVLCEVLALPATASFQENIDFILQREPIDIAVFILRSRPRSPLGASVTRTDGAAYSTADLRFDTAEGAMIDLGGYVAVVPGKPDDTELLYRITTDDEYCNEH